MVTMFFLSIRTLKFMTEDPIINYINKNLKTGTEILNFLLLVKNIYIK